MKDEQIIEVLAKADYQAEESGWFCPKCNCYVQPQRVSFSETHDREGCGCPVYWKEPSDYLASHDALQPIIDGLDMDGLCMYYNNLVMNYEEGCMPAVMMLQAAPRQKAEALYEVLK